MPYIKNENRLRFDDLLQEFADVEGVSVGELNYTITKICDIYLGFQGTDYQNINNVIGALECAKLEMYRRIVTPYENEKISENGDVYES